MMLKVNIEIALWKKYIMVCLPWYQLNPCILSVPFDHGNGEVGLTAYKNKETGQVFVGVNFDVN